MPLLDHSGLISDAIAFVPVAELETALQSAGDNACLGAIVPVEADLDSLFPQLHAADAIAINFAATGDGRGFSVAAALRDRGWCRPIRAVGPLIPDQFAFALACGFDQVEISDDQLARQPVKQWQNALASIK